MSYYLRVLSTSQACAPHAKLLRVLSQEKLSAKVSIENGDDNNWTEITVAHPDGPEIAIIERNAVTPGAPGENEIREFLDEISECKPESAVAWLRGYLPTIKTIYAIQVLSGTDMENGWAILGAVKNSIWAHSTSILQADREGFSNEDGYHILWQFSEQATGDWWMGVLKEGRWVHFKMDLGSKKHRASFLKGEVPNGVDVA